MAFAACHIDPLGQKSRGRDGREGGRGGAGIHESVPGYAIPRHRLAGVAIDPAIHAAAIVYTARCLQRVSRRSLGAAIGPAIRPDTVGESRRHVIRAGEWTIANGGHSGLIGHK